MKVSLVSITQSVINGTDLSAEELLVYIARVSNPSNQLNTETADRLIRFLIKNKHWSPFDMVNMTIEVTTSRAIAAQILRHWSIKPQEFSQRYAEATGYEPIQFRLKGDTNRQGSKDPVGGIDISNGTSWADLHYEYDYGELISRAAHLMKEVDKLYKDMLKSNIAPECARFILPLATQTTLYLNGSVRSWIHYLEQRTSNHAQLEHRLIAKETEKIFQQQFPNVYKAILNEG